MRKRIRVGRISLYDFGMIFSLVRISPAAEFFFQRTCLKRDSMNRAKLKCLWKIAIAKVTEIVTKNRSRTVVSKRRFMQRAFVQGKRIIYAAPPAIAAFLNS